MKPIKWIKNLNGWGARVGVYYIDVKMKTNRFRVEVYFGRDFISGTSYKARGEELILSDAVRYFYKVLDGKVLDRYLQN